MPTATCSASGESVDRGWVRRYPSGCSSYCAAVAVPITGLSDPRAVAVDASGDVVVADTEAATVTELPAGCAGTCAQRVLPFGPLDAPDGVAADALGDVFVADDGHRAIDELPAGCTSAACEVTVTTPDELNGESAAIESVGAVAVDSAGDLFMVDPEAGTVLEILATSTTTTTLAAAAPSPAAGRATVLVATVTSASKGGAVGFFVDGRRIAGCGRSLSWHGRRAVATCRAVLRAGRHRFSAIFSGCGSARSSSASITAPATSPPRLSDPPTTSFDAGRRGRLVLRAAGSPVPRLAAGHTPSWLRLVPSADGRRAAHRRAATRGCRAGRGGRHGVEHGRQGAPPDHDRCRGRTRDEAPWHLTSRPRTPEAGGTHRTPAERPRRRRRAAVPCRYGRDASCSAGARR